MVYLFVVYLLDRLEVEPVIVKYHYVFGVQIGLERVPLKDGLELLEQIQGMLRARDIFEAGVDEPLQGRLKLGDIDVELKEITIKRVAGVVE